MTISLRRRVGYFIFGLLPGLPIVAAELSPLSVAGGRIVREGKPFGFIGVNYQFFQRPEAWGWHKGQALSLAATEPDLVTMEHWGIRVMRLPLNPAFVQPLPGVFPDSPRYGPALAAAGLDPQYFDRIEEFIAAAAAHGIYTIIDWHGWPDDPYLAQIGGSAAQKRGGLPGSPLAIFAKSPRERGVRDFSAPAQRAYLIALHHWTAHRFKANPNLFGIEVPVNEPNEPDMAVERLWRDLVNDCIEAVKSEDPHRLCFTMSSRYGHDNYTASATWLPPDRADGTAPHFYIANDPVPLRPDAKAMKRPWLARDPDAMLGYGLAAILLPFTSVRYPMYNGEGGGDNSLESSLPNTPPAEGAELLDEASLVGYYSMGQSGYTHWILWNGPDYIRFHRAGIYDRLFPRYAPLFNQGPTDWSQAEVAVIQNPGAIPIANGNNLACVPVARLMLDLHLNQRLHYLTDRQAAYSYLAEYTKGLEQIAGAQGKFPYRALIVDTRGLDPLTDRLLATVNLPVLRVDGFDRLTAATCAQFLSGAGIDVDRRTPPEILLASGPRYLLAYRRSGTETTTRLYPRLSVPSRFQMTAEDGRVVFTGTAEQLSRTGFEATLPRWKGAIYRIDPVAP